MINMGELFVHPRLSAIPMKRVDLSESEQARFCVKQGDLLFACHSQLQKEQGNVAWSSIHFVRVTQNIPIASRE